MKKLFFVALFMAMCFSAFCEIKWLDVKEDNEEGITAGAVCTTEEEVLKITHWKDLSSHFISYSQDKEASGADVYVVVFMKLGTIVYEYHKGSKAVGYYVKTIFE